jgi:hypothetical protein
MPASSSSQLGLRGRPASIHRRLTLQTQCKHQRLTHLGRCPDITNYCISRALACQCCPAGKQTTRQKRTINEQGGATAYSFQDKLCTHLIEVLVDTLLALEVCGAACPQH